MTFLAHIADRISGRPLLITPEKAQIILSVLADRVGVLTDISVAQAEAMWPQASRFAGVPSNNGPYRVTREGVAIVPVMGTLVNRGAWIGAQSGLTSYEGLDEQLRKAKEDGGVRSILLDINTPGGEAGGCFDLADKIREIDKSKPVVAFANDMACSAGYAIASAARKVYVTKTAIVGSIGVVLVHFDHSKRLEKEGITPTIFQSGAKKTDLNPFGPPGDDVSARVKSEMDTLRDMFVASVVAGRPRLKPADVRGTEAGVFMGAQAVEAGLADAVATFESVCKSMSSDATRSVAPPAGYSPKMESQMTDTPAPAPQAPNTTALAEARAAGMSEGRQTERARISAILNSEEAQGRSDSAVTLALSSDIEPDAARKVLATLPKAREVGPANATSQIYAAIAASGGAPKVGQLDESGKAKSQFGSLADGMKKRFATNA